MRYLNLDNVSFVTENINNTFLDTLPSLEKLIINSSNNFEISFLKHMSNSLIKLSLTKNN